MQRFKEALNQIPFFKSEFSRNVLTVMSGAGIAQLLPILFALVTTKLYSPKDFGVFALYTALFYIIATIATLRYELAINLPADDTSAVNVILVSGIVNFINCTLFAIPLILFNQRIGLLLGNAPIAPWLYVLPLHCFVYGFCLSLNSWLNRKKLFSMLAMASILQALVSGVSQILIGFFGGYGLMIGLFLGNLTTCIWMLIGFNKSRQPIQTSFSALIKTAKSYRKFPIFQMPAALIEIASTQLPTILLNRFFGTEVVGLFSISQRFIRIPINLISNSFCAVFQQKASEAYALTGNARPLFNKMLKRLVMIAIIPFAILAVFAPDLFALTLGEKWRMAGDYARILAPLFFASFIVGPLSIMIIIAEKQYYMLMINSILFIAVACALSIGYDIFGSVKYALGLMTLVYIIKFSFELYSSRRFCCKE